MYRFKFLSFVDKEKEKEEESGESIDLNWGMILHLTHSSKTRLLSLEMSTFDTLKCSSYWSEDKWFSLLLQVASNLFEFVG